MVEIKYCPQCQKAKREHLFKTNICQFCGSEMVPIQASRTHYFYFMLPFLLLGAIFHLYAAYRLSFSDSGADPSVTLGLVLLGIGMYIIAIGFQVLDSKQMEKEVLVIGASRSKKPDRSPSFATGATGARPRAGGSTLKVRGPKRSAGKPPTGPEGPNRGGAGQAGDAVPEQSGDERSEPPKKGIPVRRPKEKVAAQDVAEKKAEAHATDGPNTAKKGKTSGAKAVKTGKFQKHSPPKARKILTR